MKCILALTLLAVIAGAQGSPQLRLRRNLLGGGLFQEGSFRGNAKGPDTGTGKSVRPKGYGIVGNLIGCDRGGLFSNGFLGIGKKHGGGGGLLGGILDGLLGTVGGVLNGVLSGDLSGALSIVAQTVDALTDELDHVVKNIFIDLRTATGLDLPFVEALLNQITDTVDNLVINLTTAVSGLLQELGVNGIVGSVTSLLDGLLGGGPGGTLKLVNGLFGGVAQVLKGTVGTTLNLVNSLTGGVVVFVGDTVEGLVDIVQGIDGILSKEDLEHLVTRGTLDVDLFISIDAPVIAGFRGVGNQFITADKAANILNVGSSGINIGVGIIGQSVEKVCDFARDMGEYSSCLSRFMNTKHHNKSPAGALLQALENAEHVFDRRGGGKTIRRLLVFVFDYAGDAGDVDGVLAVAERLRMDLKVEITVVQIGSGPALSLDRVLGQVSSLTASGLASLFRVDSGPTLVSKIEDILCMVFSVVGVSVRVVNGNLEQLEVTDVVGDTVCDLFSLVHGVIMDLLTGVLGG